jgi:hypothetical protein
MQHRYGTVELCLRRGAARDRKVDLAELPFLGSCERLARKIASDQATIPREIPIRDMALSSVRFGEAIDVVPNAAILLGLC